MSVTRLVQRSVWGVERRGFGSHLRGLISSGRGDCLGCAELLCLACLFGLACFFPSSFSSLIKNMCMQGQGLKAETRCVGSGTWLCGICLLIGVAGARMALPRTAPVACCCTCMCVHALWCPGGMPNTGPHVIKLHLYY